MNQEIKKIIQNHAKECMENDYDYDMCDEAEIYEYIAWNYCDDFEEEYQLAIYPSIIGYYPSKKLTAIHNKFGLRGSRRSMYDTIVAAIMLEAEPLRVQNVFLRDNAHVIFQQPPNAFEQPQNA